MEEDQPQDNKYEEHLPLGNILELQSYNQQGTRSKLQVKGYKTLTKQPETRKLVTFTHSGKQRKVTLVKFANIASVQEHAHMNVRTMVVGRKVDKPALKQPFEKRKRNYKVLDVANMPIDPNKKVPGYMKAVFAHHIGKPTRKKHHDDGRLVSTIRQTKLPKITPYDAAVGLNVCGNGNMVNEGAMSQMKAVLIYRDIVTARAERVEKRSRSNP